MDKNLEQQTLPKQVAILVAQQSLILHGGIGQFTKGFCDMALDLGWSVDLILDGIASNYTIDMIHHMRKGGWRGNVWHVDRPLSYADYQETLENRHKDGINFEKEINFRDAFYTALQRGRKYDLIICNNPEAFLPVYSMGLTSKIPTVFYTHNENFIGIEDDVGPFSKEYNDVYERLLTLPNIILGTQTIENVKRMKRVLGLDAMDLPMPLPDRSILQPYFKKADDRQGVLFIGRWEDRKDPKTFVKMIVETGLPARIITNNTGQAKFRVAFAEAKYTNYNIVTALNSEAKADFIRGSSVYVSTAKKEAFCYAAFECIPHCHVVLLNDYEWSVPFEGKPNVHRVPKKNLADTVSRLHLTPVDHRAGLRELVRYQDNAQVTWASFLATRVPSTATIPQLKSGSAASVDALFA